MRSRPLTAPAATLGVRGRRTAQLVAVPHRPGLVEVGTLNAARLGWRLLVMALGHPLLSTVGLVLAIALHRYGLWLVLSVAVVLAAVCGLWRFRWPGSFEGCVAPYARAGFRRLWVYGRNWQPAMVMSELADTFAGREWLPELRRVRSTRWGDAVLVGLLSGQSPADFERAAEALAHTFGAASCRVRVAQPGRVWLQFTRRDPLAAVVPALPVPGGCDPARLVVGVAEDPAGGVPAQWALRLLGSHLLIAGATGSGKGSVLWSLVRALAPGVRDGSVQLWAVDPKGGMELTPGAGMFTRFAYADTGSMVDLLEAAVILLRERAERLRRAGARLHTPSVAEPLVVVLVDELAALVAYGADRELRKRAEQALWVLLSQGRAPGVLVVAAVQDPSKDVVAFRDLFPVRVALRLVEDVQVDMVLGRGARARGAECDRISPALPGVGFVQQDGVREPIRVRAADVTDDELRAMARDHPALSAAGATVGLRLVDGAA
jgi:DNA segregation ATPase FtsK/SpoIIIE, S-DNA-T family